MYIDINLKRITFIEKYSIEDYPDSRECKELSIVARDEQAFHWKNKVTYPFP
jgi:hypothetical protein